MNTWGDLLVWVNDPTRTAAQLRNLATALVPHGMVAITGTRNRNQIRTALRTFIGTKPAAAQAPVILDPATNNWIANPAYVPVAVAPIVTPVVTPAAPATPTPHPAPAPTPAAVVAAAPAPRPTATPRRTQLPSWAATLLGAIGLLIGIVFCGGLTWAVATGRVGNVLTRPQPVAADGTKADPAPQGERPQADPTVPAAQPTTQVQLTQPVTGTAPMIWDAPSPGELDSMPKTVIDLAPEGQWFHRVFNPRLFHAPDWSGADSWFVTLAVGPNSGGAWTSFGNPGQMIYRGSSNQLSWCLGVLTTSQYKSEFLAGAPDMSVAINVRITPNTLVSVTGPTGTQTQPTSDAGDITVVLPDNGIVTVCTAYTTAMPTHESHVWWGPYDRAENINTIDAR